VRDPSRDIALDGPLGGTRAMVTGVMVIVVVVVVVVVPAAAIGGTVVPMIAMQVHRIPAPDPRKWRWLSQQA
jgi:hypothetical protein